MAAIDDDEFALDLQIAEAMEASGRNAAAASTSFSRSFNSHGCVALLAASHERTARAGATLAALFSDAVVRREDDTPEPEEDPRRADERFSVFFKGMLGEEVVGPRDWSPPKGKVVLRVRRLVEGFAGSGVELEAMRASTSSALMSTSELPALLTQESDETDSGLATTSCWRRGRDMYFQCLKKIHASSSFAKSALGETGMMRRKCVRCRGAFCVGCKVPWHDGLTCSHYRRKYPDPRLDDAKLQSLARQRLWRQCVRCKHLIELAAGCRHMTCVCGYEFCYKCRKDWNKGARCSCVLLDIIRPRGRGWRR